MSSRPCRQPECTTPRAWGSTYCYEHAPLHDQVLPLAVLGETLLLAVGLLGLWIFIVALGEMLLP